MQTCLNLTHNDLLFDEGPKGCNLIKKETLEKMFSCEFCEISRNNFLNSTHIRETVFRLNFVNPRKKVCKRTNLLKFFTAIFI